MEVEVDEEVVVVRPRKVKAPVKAKSRLKEPLPPVDATTNMEDLDSESESEEEKSIRRPPIGIRSGAGSYEISDDFGEEDEPNRNLHNNIRHKGDTTATNGSKLMAQALAMQKDRE